VLCTWHTRSLRSCTHFSLLRGGQEAVFPVVVRREEEVHSGQGTPATGQEAEQEVDLRGGTHIHTPDIANGLFTKHVGLSVHTLTIFYVRLFT